VANNEDIMEILVKLTEGQTEIKSSLHNVDSRLNKIELVQEEIKTKVITLGELHQAHGEQQERLFKVSDNVILEKMDYQWNVDQYNKYYNHLFVEVSSMKQNSNATYS